MGRSRSSSPISVSRRTPRPGVGHIVRINHPANHTLGWQARIMTGTIRAGRRTQHTYRSRFYADQKYGGKEKAYDLAVAWLNTSP